MMKQIEYKAYLHIFQRAPHSWETEETCISSQTFDVDYTGRWEQICKTSKLLAVVPICEILTLDPLQGAVEALKAEMTQIRANAEVALKEKRDRINDLLMIGYTAEPEVTEVQCKREAEDFLGTDDDMPF